MKKTILFVAVILFAGGGLAEAAHGGLHGTVGATLDSRYIWRGITVFGSKGGFHPFVDVDLYGTGFGLNVEGHLPIGSQNVVYDPPLNVGLQELERWDITPYYKGICSPDEKLEMRYMLGYRYFYYPEADHGGGPTPGDLGSYDLQEVLGAVAMPNVLGVPGLVPSLAVLKTWPSYSGTVVGAKNPNGGTYAGTAYVLMLDYGIPISGILADVPEQTIKLHAETVFNDGVDPRPAGPYSDSDWTHYVLSASTDFDLGNNVVFTPGIYYQHTMEEHINDDPDILWVRGTFAYKF